MVVGEDSPVRFHHHMVHVRDLDRAIAFYSAVFACTVADRHDYDGTRLVYLAGIAPGIELELICPATWDFAERPETGRSHIAFTVDDLAAEHARLAGLGAAPGPITDYRAGGVLQTRFFYVEDPDGNQIEFLDSVGRYSPKEDGT